MIFVVSLFDSEIETDNKLIRPNINHQYFFYTIRILSV